MLKINSGIRYGWILCSLIAFKTAPSMADGSAIDKIYHPYVQPLEQEFELRTLIESNASQSQGSQNTLRIGYGQSINDNLFGEVYLIGVENDQHSFQLQKYEVEVLWQLTEQGEFFADWGLLFEFEKFRADDIAEFSSSLLIEKEWSKWVTTVNLSGIYEFGDDIKTEFESAIALQTRYRHAMYFEPAMELYKGQNTFGIGPVILGSYPLGDARRIRWEAGVIFGLQRDTPDHTLKTLLEYEF